MKKLSEIGREVVELSDMEFVHPDTVDWGDEPETKKFTVISDAERRELVTRAVNLTLRLVADHLSNLEYEDLISPRQLSQMVLELAADDILKEQGI